MKASSCLNSSGNNGNEVSSDFECNVCLELAQDPVVTLCGHLFCWPCLYKWLHLHSTSQNCPVCKAVIEEGKLVPLYGRGRNPTDPRSKSIPGVHTPHRPAGQRPETAPPSAPYTNYDFTQPELGFADRFRVAWFPALVSPVISYLTFQAVHWPNDGVIPSWYPDMPRSPGAALFYGGGADRFDFGMADSVHGHSQDASEQQNSTLKLLLLVIAVFLLIAMIS